MDIIILLVILILWLPTVLWIRSILERNYAPYTPPAKQSYDDNARWTTTITTTTTFAKPPEPSDITSESKPKTHLKLVVDDEL